MPLIEEADNGGSQIVSYNLQIDDANGGPFVSVGGFDPISMQTEYTLEDQVSLGLTYRLRYRVKNAVDEDSWSDFSDVLYALVSSVPSPPDSPSLISATADSITLQFYESADGGGSKILEYELEVDQGVQGTSFSKVESYDGTSLQHTLSTDPVTGDGILSGTTYTFRVRARNIVGFSVYSNEARYVISSPPEKPNAPTKNYNQSTKTSMVIQWSESVAT